MGSAEGIEVGSTLGAVDGVSEGGGVGESVGEVDGVWVGRWLLGAKVGFLVGKGLKWLFVGARVGSGFGFQ